MKTIPYTVCNISTTATTQLSRQLPYAAITRSCDGALSYTDKIAHKMTQN